MTTTPTPASTTRDIRNVEKLARNVVATYDDPHLSPVAVERAIGMLRKELGEQSPARSDKMSAAEDNKYELPGDMGENWSPARSDKDAERFGSQEVEDDAREAVEAARERIQRIAELHFYAPHANSMDERLFRFAMALLAAKAQESAPSSVEIATWDARQRESGYGRNAEACMLDEIADLRAALARRATAGNAAPTEAELDKMWAARFFVSQALHNVMVGNQSAWIEWKHGAGAEAAMQWIENGLIGPGLIPSGTEAQAWFNANEDERLEVPPRPALSRLAGAAKGGATNDNSSSELASNTATAAPGDLPPLPKIYGGNYSVGELEVMLSEYGRACIASNAGAAVPEGGAQ